MLQSVAGPLSLASVAHKVCVIGASGFTGAELLRLCAGHPDLEVAAATGASAAGRKVAELYPSLAPLYPSTELVPYGPGLASGCDLAFCALPHGASQALIGELRGEVAHIVDLAADFRLRDADLYPQWYGEPHTAPELLGEFVFGLPELFRRDIRGAELVAAPGCYVTAAALALAPLAAKRLIEPSGIVVNAASGVSGAGRAPKPHTSFCAVDEDFTAYGVLNHRHTPEIEMAVARFAGLEAPGASRGARSEGVQAASAPASALALPPGASRGARSEGVQAASASLLEASRGARSEGVQVLFTPHLAPMSRGILATCYARPTGAFDTAEVIGALADAYADEPFVVVSERLPSTKAALGSNSVHITARADRRTGWVIVISALDNLVKGASGQAVQCANLALGLNETAGLTAAGLYP